MSLVGVIGKSGWRGLGPAIGGTRVNRGAVAGRKDGSDGVFDFVFLVLGAAGGFFESGGQFEFLAVEGEAFASEPDFFGPDFLFPESNNPTDGRAEVLAVEMRGGGDLKGVLGEGGGGGLAEGVGLARRASWGRFELFPKLPQAGTLGEAAEGGGMSLDAEAVGRRGGHVIENGGQREQFDPSEQLLLLIFGQGVENSRA